MKKHPKPEACLQRPSHATREMEIFGRNFGGGNVGNLPPTPWVIRETTQPDLLLGGPIPCACTRHTTEASEPTRYSSIDDHVRSQGASLTPDIPPAHPSLQQHQDDAICWLQLPVPSPSLGSRGVPAARKNPAHAPSPSRSWAAPREDCKELTALFSARRASLSPETSSKKTQPIFKRTERIGLSAGRESSSALPQLSYYTLSAVWAFACMCVYVRVCLCEKP